MKMRDLMTLVENMNAAKPVSYYQNIFWYHGSDNDFDQFDSKHTGSRMGRQNAGFWFSDDPKLTGFYGPNQYKVKLDIENPFIITDEDYDQEFNKNKSNLLGHARNSGYDSVIIEDTIDGDVESTICFVFDHEAIEIVDKIIYNED